MREKKQDPSGLNSSGLLLSLHMHVDLQLGYSVPEWLLEMFDSLSKAQRAIQGTDCQAGPITRQHVPTCNADVALRVGTCCSAVGSA
jgi:hypothetical protein